MCLPCIKGAGAHGKKTIFLITDTQIKEEAFLEDIDSLLNTGEVANLYAADEKQELIEAVRPVMQAKFGKDKDFTPLAMFSFFVQRCKENLHIMICFSPIGDAFRERLRQFPSLINCCTIDWLVKVAPNSTILTLSFFGGRRFSGIQNPIFGI